MFGQQSRYFDLEDAQLATQDGNIITYKKRRFLPQPNKIPTREVIMTEGDRIDTISSIISGDPEKYWQICDVNTTMDPQDLTSEVGKVLKIPTDWS